MHEELHVVGIGGGSGLSTLLDGLREVGGRPRDRRLRVTAIVSVADDGGSTGRLRTAFGIPAVGDIRQCLSAMAGGDTLWPELFQHRFQDQQDVGGHALGNLVLAALIEQSGGLQAALDRLVRPLRLRGRVLAVTEEPVTLMAQRTSGELVSGESRIPDSGDPIERIWLNPEEPAPTSGVLEAIENADAIVLGPGSLYTSILPNLLVPGVADAIRRSRAVRILASNLTTQPGETDRLSAADHLDVVRRYAGDDAIDVCLGDDSSDQTAAETDLEDAAAARVLWDPERIRAAGALPIATALRASGASSRHDSIRLATAVLSLARTLQPTRRRHGKQQPQRRPRARFEVTRAAAAALVVAGMS